MKRAVNAEGQPGSVYERGRPRVVRISSSSVSGEGSGLVRRHACLTPLPLLAEAGVELRLREPECRVMRVQRGELLEGLRETS